MARLAPLIRDQLTPAQIEVYDSIVGTRGTAAGPFGPMLRSPGLAKRLEQVGAYLRYHSPLPAGIREMAICMVGARHQADVEWNAHAPLAEKNGISKEVLDAIGAGRRPDFKDEKERIAYDFVNEAIAAKGLSDKSFKEVQEAFGEEGMLDLIGIAGYYTTLAMILNSFEVRPDTVNIPIPWGKG